nr:WecB/TagA/CpsF family glycosyltransferase [uncultured Acidocella sp.]
MNRFGLRFATWDMMTVRTAILEQPDAAAFHYIVTPNVDHLERLRRQPGLRPLYREAWLCLFDSRCLARLLGLFGRAMPPVVTGADLTADLLPHLAGMRVAVIGMEEADFAALRLRYPAILFHRHAPPMGLLTNLAAQEDVLDFLRQLQPRVSFFAVGSPVQEILAHRLWREGGGSGVGLCIGAALAFAAGTAQRAPPWMRRAGLEWLHRLAKEPRRLSRRYLLDGPRLLLALARAEFRPGHRAREGG